MRSHCGRVLRQQLAEKPVKQIADSPADEGNLCASCVRKTGYVRASIGADPIHAAWIGFINRYLKHSHIKIDDTAVELLAAKLRDVGPPELRAALDLFDGVKVLLLRPTRDVKAYDSGKTRSSNTLPQLRKAVLAMKEPGDLQKVIGVLRTWEQVTGRNPFLERFNSERVVTVMLQVPDAAAYIKHLSDRGLPTLASIFHPNTFDRAKRDTALRGLFAGSSQYWEQTSGQLNIVTD